MRRLSRFYRIEETWYGRLHSRGFGQSQNVVQNAGSAGDGIGADGTVALGKISVSASVSMAFQLQP